MKTPKILFGGKAGRRLLLYFLQIFFFMPVLAQPILHKIELPPAAAQGERIEIVLHGEKLNEVMRIDSLRMSGRPLEVPRILSKSDRRLVIQTRIPANIPAGKHVISVLVSDELRQIWLEPRLEMSHDSRPLKNREEIAVHFKQNESGELVSGFFRIKNSGSGPLTLITAETSANIKIPVELSGVLLSGQSANFYLTGSGLTDAQSTEKIYLKFRELPEPFEIKIHPKLDALTIRFSLRGENQSIFPAEEERAVAFSGASGVPLRQIFNLKNLGKTVLEVDSIIMNPPFFLNGLATPKLSPGDSADLYIELRSDSAGIFSQTCAIHFSQPARQSFQFMLTATVAPDNPPEIVIMDGSRQVFPAPFPSVIFDAAAIGESPQKFLKVTNAGEAPAAILRIALSPGFSLAGEYATTLNSGQSAYLPIAMNTDSARALSGKLSVQLRQKLDHRIEIQLSGVVVKASPAAEPAIQIVDNGAVEIITRTFALLNRGENDLILENLQIPPDFGIERPLPRRVAGGGVDSFSLTLPYSTWLRANSIIQFDIAGRDDNPQILSLAQTTFLLPTNKNFPLWWPWPLLLAALLALIYFACKIFRGVRRKSPLREPDAEAVRIPPARFRIQTNYDVGRQEILNNMSDENSGGFFVKSVFDPGMQMMNTLATPESEAQADDLTRIEGVGPKISVLLNDAGIFTYEQLAASKYEILRKILDESSIWMIDPTTWPEQSALARDGRWKELRKLQTALKAGRRVKV